jgi:hypothetical protein
MARMVTGKVFQQEAMGEDVAAADPAQQQAIRHLVEKGDQS